MRCASIGETKSSVVGVTGEKGREGMRAVMNRGAGPWTGRGWKA